jgi:hypothetical protein
VASCLDQVPGPLLAQHQAPLDRLREEVGLSPAQIGPVSLAHVDQPEQGQRLERLANHRPPDAEGFGQLALGRNSLAGLDVAGQQVGQQPSRDLRGDGLAPSEIEAFELTGGAIETCRSTPPAAG